MSTNKLNYLLSVKGVFGRNRSVKLEVIELFKRVDPLAPKTVAELQAAARDKLAEIKAKPGCRYVVKEQPIELGEDRTYGDVVLQSESFVLFSDRKILEGVVGGAEEVLADPTAHAEGKSPCSDTVCACVHWYEEHRDDGSCDAPDCDCTQFQFDAELNTPRAIADRGGEHQQKTCRCNDCRSLRGEALNTGNG